MSRLEKRLHQDAVLSGTAADDDVGVRLFAFHNLTKGYAPEFSPEGPIIVLKSKKGSVDQHPCAQWKPLADDVFKRDREFRSAVFVVDTTGLPKAAEREEEASVLLPGPVLKRTANILLKLNAHDATLVAAGASSVLALKLLLLSDRKHNSRGVPLFQKLVLVAPKVVDPLAALLAHVAKRRQTDGPSPKLDVVVMIDDAAQLPLWKAFAASSAATAVLHSVNLSTTMAPLFSSIVENCGVVQVAYEGVAEGADDYRRLAKPNLYHIRFLLSRYTKQVEQEIEPSSLEDWPPVASDPPLPASAGDSRVTRHVAAPAPTESAMSPLDDKRSLLDQAAVLLCELAHRREQSSFFVEGFVLDPLACVVGNAQGVMTVVCASDAIGAASKQSLSTFAVGDAVRLCVVQRRSLKGRTSLVLAGSPAVAVVRITDPQALKDSVALPTSVSEVGSWCGNLSTISQSFGVLIVRGRRCVLVRSLTGEYAGMRMPHQLHTDPRQSAAECAVEAACMQCDVSEDNFGIHPAIAPVTYYPSSRCSVTIFVAFANYATAASDNCSAEDTEDLSDPYDWLTFGGALQRLSTRAERRALEQLAENISNAAKAQVYTPPAQLVVFGDSLSSSASRTTEGPLPSLDVEPRELLVVHDATAAGVAVFERQFKIDASSSSVLQVLDCSSLNADALLLWLRMDKSSKIVYLQEDSTQPGTVVDYFYSVWFDDVVVAECRGVRMTFVSHTHINPTLSSVFLSNGEASSASTLALQSLVLSAQTGDQVLITHDDDGGVSSKAATVAAEFVRSVLPDDAAVPILFDWSDPTEFYVDERDNGCSSSDDAAEPTVVQVKQHFAVLRYRRSVPFRPALLASLLNTSDLLSKVVWAEGSCWLSTRFAYRGDVCVLNGRLQVKQGDPWWCLVPEADRPENVCTSTWDSKHGDRGQDLTFIFRNISDGSDEATSDMCARFARLLDEMLCDASEWRFWQREEDPLPPWNA